MYDESMWGVSDEVFLKTRLPLKFEERLMETCEAAETDMSKEVAFRCVLLMAYCVGRRHGQEGYTYED
jgi:hypothetical protein